MAFDFSKLNFFSRLDARARVLVLFGAVIGVGILIYVLVSMASSDGAAVGPSSVASAPQGLQSVPGGELTPEYYRALMQANTQAAQQAQISGGSAVPTLVNASSGQPAVEGGCTVLCGDESVDVKNDLENWVKQGKLSSDVSTYLQELAGKHVSVAEYAAELDRLVREGKLTPEQARQLLEQYQKQHASYLAKESASMMDGYIKSGKMSLDAANQLLAAQKRNVTPAEYSDMLQELVRQGKIDPDTAQRLLNQYMQQRAKEIVARSVTSIKQMTSAGQLTPEVEKVLVDMEERMVPLELYEAKLNGFIEAGKITPAVAKKILDEFKQQKKDMGTINSTSSLIKQAEDAAYQELIDLLKEGKISQDTASRISTMIQKNVSYIEFESAIAQMVQEGKLTPELSKLKLADYKKVKDLRDLASKLNDLQANNRPCSENEQLLKDAVQASALTPDEAAQLMKECQGSTMQMLPATTSAGALGELQERLQSTSTVTQATSTDPETFAAVQQQSQEDLEQARMARIEDLVSAMQGQASQLISAWQPPVMMHKEGLPIKDKQKDGSGNGGGAANAADDKSGAANPSAASATSAPIIKGGTILFAVLDTAVNSDYPDSPVMATIVTGPFKGAKMLGKLITTKGVSGQMDRVTLNFTMMNLDTWPKSKTVTSYAIDPDTARTVLASNVNYHYMQRFGALMATSFLQGYGTAVMASGSSTSSTPGASGVLTSSNPQLSPSNKLAVAFGQMAQAVGQATKNYTERPPTVIVDSGVGLGILFMTDVT